MLAVFFSSVLLLIASSAYANPQGGHVYEAETDCFNQFPSIDRDFIEQLKRTKKLPENPSNDFKCFIACVGKAIGVMSHDGDLHFDNLKQVTVDITAGDATHDDAHGMVSKCFDVDHADNCEKAYLYVVCKIDELLPYAFSKDFCPTCNAK